jgi:hypothetical protein
MTIIKKPWNGGVITGEAAVVEHVIDELELQRSKLAATKEKWGTGDERMVRLCHAFPTLRGVPGTDPWNALRFLEWLCTSGGVTTGSKHAGRFVLQVWNPSTDWGALAMQPLAEEGLGLKDVELAPFNVVQALAAWDSDHERAFCDWAELPFWP